METEKSAGLGNFGREAQGFLPSPLVLEAPRGGDRGPAPGRLGVPEPAARTRGQLGSASAAAVGDSSSQQAPLLRPTRVAALPAGSRSAVRVGEKGANPAPFTHISETGPGRNHSSPPVLRVPKGQGRVEQGRLWREEARTAVHVGGG